MELPRGMRDLEAGELARIESVREAFVRTARLFSFQLVEPSPLESLSTLELKSGPAIRDEIYAFKDKGEREVALRFDFTVGLSRYVAAQQSMPLPAKFGTFGGVFRYDEPQKGRYRFFHQWNVEIFGRPGIESESEVIEFAARLFEALGMDIKIHISHRGLVESFVRRHYPDSEDNILADSLRLIDKAAKKSKDKLLSEYSHLSPDYTSELLAFSKVRGTPDEVESAAKVSEIDAWGHVKKLYQSLQNRSVHNILIDLGIVRGLDYYSGTVYEVFDSSGIGALAGGGRYDSLMRAFGREDIGATGIAGGVERMILAMKGESYTAASTVAVLYTGDEMQSHAARITSRLRACGISAEMDLTGRPLKKQMAAAADSNYSIIVGPREMNNNQLVLKEMGQGTESTIPLEELLNNPANFILKTPG